MHDKSTAHPQWRTVLYAQGRTLRWLALQTGTKPRTVYAYSQGTVQVSDAWLAKVSAVLGEEVTR